MSYSESESIDRIARAKADVPRLEKEIAVVDDQINVLTEMIDAISTRLMFPQLSTHLKGQLKDQKQRLKDERGGLLVQMIRLERRLRILERHLTTLNADLTEGKYFATTDDIFPREHALLLKRSDFSGAADKMMRDNAPGSIYKAQVGLFLQQLKDPSPEVDLDISSLSSSQEESEADSGNAAPWSVVPVKNKTVQKAHLIPDEATCCPWWSLVCLWAIGAPKELKELYDQIEVEQDKGQRSKLVERLLQALMALVIGVSGGQNGMRNNERNFLYLPWQHDLYYDFGYNWVIIPIMTLNEMKEWKGGSYDVAVFVGSHGGRHEWNACKELNLFQDGQGAARNVFEAESELLGRLDFGNGEITICSKDDIEKVGEILMHFFMAFADLHTRSYDKSGSNIGAISPRKWGIIDLAAGAKKIMEAMEGSAPTIFEESKKGIENIVKRLLRGVHIPKCPTESNCFDGKHVFKGKVRQEFPADPILVGAKGAVNVGRQYGISFLPSCPPPPEDDSDVSCQPSTFEIFDDESDDCSDITTGDFDAGDDGAATGDTIVFDLIPEDDGVVAGDAELFEYRDSA